MSTSIVVGLDGSPSGDKALAFARRQAKLIGDCKIVVTYIIEWSPYSFQTAEENERRHQRREEEISTAHERIVDPAIKELQNDGFEVEGYVRHGDAAAILDRVAVEHRAEQIVVGREGHRSLRKRLFGNVTGDLVASASVPVTVVA